MSKWYDEFATNCSDCGFLQRGEYQDGMPYLSCMRYGTIMHAQSGEVCEGWRSPGYVARMLEEQERDESRRKAERRMRRLQQKDTEDV